MKLRQTYLYFIIMAIAFAPEILAFKGSHTLFVPRSQSVNAARELVGWYIDINQQSANANYWVFSLNPSYNHSYKNEQITSFLLGKNQLSVAGSRVASRSKDAILADYFGLPSDYQGSICFSPTISTFINNFDWFWGLDGVVNGLYFKVHAPVVHTVWNLHFIEKVSVAGSLDYPAGYMGPVRILNSTLEHSLKSVMNNIIQPKIFGDMKDPLSYGRVFMRQTRSRFSDIQIALGYNAYRSSNAHFGLNIRGSIPAGNKPNPTFLFDPIIGNAHHWELGLGLSWHIDAWFSKNEKSNFSIYSDLNITHLFKDTQCRSYDLYAPQNCKQSGCDKNNGNRYVLLEQFFTPEQSEVHVDGMPVTMQYEGNIMPAINVTTLKSEVSFPVQVDGTLMFAYHRSCNLDINWGYNVWFRSAEKLHARAPLAENKYAFKGDAQIYGFDSNNPIKLTVTQSEATLNAGQNGGNFVSMLYANNNADNPIRADNASNSPLTQLNATDSADFNIVQTNIQTSNPTKLLKNEDINEYSALMPRALTHKVFLHAGRVWKGYDRKPFFGIGAEFEWRCACVHSNAGVSQWGVWIKGGFSC